MTRNVLVACFFATLFTGCQNPKIIGAGESENLLALTMSDLGPTTFPGDRAKIMLAGTEIPVDLSHELKGNEYSITLHTHGQVFETEQYEVSKTTFSLKSAVSEVYQPALPLLSFPLKAGAQAAWKGTMTAGGVKRRASATVLAGLERIAVEDRMQDAISIKVNLQIENGEGIKPATRNLTFYFEPKKGLVRREFGKDSVREPFHRELGAKSGG